jgi:hypothetical protein
MATLPRDFAPSLVTPVGYRARKLEKLLRQPESLRTALEIPTVVPLPNVKKPAPGECTAALCKGKTGGAT